MGNCRVEGGKYAVLIKGQRVRVSEETHNLSNCNLEAGSVIRILLRRWVCGHSGFF